MRNRYFNLKKLVDELLITGESFEDALRELYPEMEIQDLNKEELDKLNSLTRCSDCNCWIEPKDDQLYHCDSCIMHY